MSETANTSGPKCVICYAPGKWFCAFCGSNCFCDQHACHHLAKQYPDEFGVKQLGPKEQQKQETQQTNRFILIAIAVVLVFLLLIWMWIQPSSGSSETMLVVSPLAFSG